MPTLEWIGRDKVVNHNMKAPYRVSERRYICDDGTSEHSVILHGQEDPRKAYYEVYT